MYALVDCNSFFCSVERVFHPELRNRPVCVLSSNDGIIVALTPEAKAVGLHRGDPLFKVQSIVDKHKVAVLSSNMQLYAAMSKRIVNILRESIYHVENYSIDESFCDLSGYNQYYDLERFMRDIADKIRLYTDIPVSVGVAPTKTLAKIGSKFAKNYKGYKSVCMIDNETKRRKALELFELSDIWGIGRKNFEKLVYYGVRTPLELADKSEKWIKAHFSKPMWQTWMELNGHPCIDTSEILRNQTICTSRSFANMVSDRGSLQAAVANFAASSANKLRAQSSVAKTISVFAGSNRFREDLDQYHNCASVGLITATADTIEITRAALQALDRIYRPDILYKKAGVVLSDISDASHIDADIFDPIENRPQRAKLMKVMDDINQRYGLKTIRLEVEGPASQPWKVRCEHRSPNYLTDIDHIPIVSSDVSGL